MILISIIFYFIYKPISIISLALLSFAAWVQWDKYKEDKKTALKGFLLVVLIILNIYTYPRSVGLFFFVFLLTISYFVYLSIEAQKKRNRKIKSEKNE